MKGIPMTTTVTSRRPARPRAAPETKDRATPETKDRATPETKDRAAPEAKDGDGAAVLVSGIVDARGNQAFVRTRGYRRGQDDVYVPATCLREYGLRTGDHIEGAARPGRRRADGRAGRQDKERDARGTLDRVDAINGLTPEQSRQRPEFDMLTPCTRRNTFASKQAPRPQRHGSSTWSARSARASAA